MPKCPAQHPRRARRRIRRYLRVRHADVGASSSRISCVLHARHSARGQALVQRRPRPAYRMDELELVKYPQASCTPLVHRLELSEDYALERSSTLYARRTDHAGAAQRHALAAFRGKEFEHTRSCTTIPAASAACYPMRTTSPTAIPSLCALVTPLDRAGFLVHSLVLALGAWAGVSPNTSLQTLRSTSTAAPTKTPRWPRQSTGAPRALRAHRDADAAARCSSGCKEPRRSRWRGAPCLDVAGQGQRPRQRALALATPGRAGATHVVPPSLNALLPIVGCLFAIAAPATRPRFGRLHSNSQGVRCCGSAPDGTMIVAFLWPVP